MKIAILSRSPRSYSTLRLQEAAWQRGHQAKVLDTLKFGMFIERDAPDLTFNGKPLSMYDAVIPRIGSSVTFYGTAVVRQFEQSGVFALNKSKAITVSRDKLRSLQVLSRHSIGMPATAFVRRRREVLPAIERIGGVPVIIKLLEGTQGIGVILADNTKIAEAIIETLQSKNQNVLIQKFVAESKGKDIRALVVGNRVVAAMRRKATGQEFRSNIHRGGITEAIQLDEEYERTAVLAAQIMDLRVAGVDMLEGKDGPQIMEVNSSPGLEGIEKASKIDVAGAIIDYLQEEVHFQEVDINQRLRTAKGYIVAEVPVLPQSEFAGKMLNDSQLREREVSVLHINRNGLVIPNPQGSREILIGDILLCYGKQAVLKSLIPSPALRKKRTKKVAR